jgi:sugar lactone lactonase YvrE
MLGKIRLLASGVVLLLAACSASEAPPRLETVGQAPAGPGNITVTPDGRAIVSVHPTYSGERVAMAVAGGEATWFPAEGQDLARVLAVRATRHGKVFMLAGMPDQQPKRIYIVDVASGAVERTISIDAPGSFYNDMALALDKGTVVMTDPGGPSALVVLDVATGTVRHVLVGHPSVAPEDVDALIDGVPLAQGPAPLRSGANPITIDSRSEWVYYGPMTGHSLWRVRIDDLRDASLSAEELAARVERHGDKPSSAGVTIDEAGNVYVTDVGARAIGVISPDGAYRVLVQDDTLLDWPDGLAVDDDGYVYAAVNGLYRNWVSHDFMPKPEPPFPVVRFKALSATRAGR